ncbi:hypothetical protein H8356DRAFT_1416147 [Neocallimastix lanati (nom. inval.)]|nr:hypothetical protein H8356DRAFT_1416147 [Neocallimastix sp. JGI-2020a]
MTTYQAKANFICVTIVKAQHFITLFVISYWAYTDCLEIRYVTKGLSLDRLETKVFGYRPGNNSSAFNVSTHEGAGTFQALANKELTSPKANWASGL